MYTFIYMGVHELLPRVECLGLLLARAKGDRELSLHDSLLF